MTEKKNSNLKHLMITATPEDFERIKKFCEAEGLYLGRFVVRCTLRHIDEIETEHIRKQLRKFDEKA